MFYVSVILLLLVSTCNIPSYAAESQNYKLTSYVLSVGGQTKGSSNYMFLPDVIGDPIIGKLEGAKFMLIGGFIPTLDLFAEEDYIDFIIDIILKLPEDAFKPPAEQRKIPLVNKLKAILVMIEEGRYQEAIDKLENDILAKIDGSLGGNPNNDWIIDPDVQRQLSDIINSLIIYLCSLL